MSLDKKNLIIFNPCTNEEFNTILQTAQTSKLSRKIVLMEKLFLTMDFQYRDDRIVIKDYFPNENMIRFTRFATAHNTRAWIFDLKELYYFRIFKEEFQEFSNIINIIDNFEELESFVLNFKHRFASKKFGL